MVCQPYILSTTARPYGKTPDKVEKIRHWKSLAGIDKLIGFIYADSTETKLILHPQLIGQELLLSYLPIWCLTAYRNKIDLSCWIKLVLKWNKVTYPVIFQFLPAKVKGHTLLSEQFKKNLRNGLDANNEWQFID